MAPIPTQWLRDLGHRQDELCQIHVSRSLAWSNHSTTTLLLPSQSPGLPGGARPWEMNSQLLPHANTQANRKGEKLHQETRVLIWHMVAQTLKVTYPTNTTTASSYPQLDLGPLAQPLLPGISGAQSRGVQASVLLHTCALITHHLAKSEAGLGSTSSNILPPRTVASQALLLASL